jgi:hypothetical protein
MKDDKKLLKVAKGSDVHVELKGADMLTQRCVVKRIEFVEEEK